MVLLGSYFPKSTLLLKKLCQRFFELELEHCTPTENRLRNPLFYWYCNFDPPTRLIDVGYLWNE